MDTEPTLDLKWLQGILPEDRDCVFGFVRESEASLFPDKKDNPYFNIPSLVSYIILYYYYVAEYFGIHGEDMELNDSSDTVTHIGGSYDNTAYGVISIDFDKELIYEWIIEIIKLPDYIKGKTFITGIGFASNREYSHICFGDGQGAYTIFWNNGQYEGTEVGVRGLQFKQGDTVRITVDTKLKQCQLFVNEKQSAMTPIDTESKYFAITLNESKTSIKLTQFQINAY